MFGTVGRVTSTRRTACDSSRSGARSAEDVPGFQHACVMFPEKRENEVILAVLFQDADSYSKNADDPAQHQRYLEYRALLEDEPEWADGEWFAAEEG